MVLEQSNSSSVYLRHEIYLPWLNKIVVFDLVLMSEYQKGGGYRLMNLLSANTNQIRRKVENSSATYKYAGKHFCSSLIKKVSIFLAIH